MILNTNELMDGLVALTYFLYLFLGLWGLAAVLDKLFGGKNNYLVVWHFVLGSMWVAAPYVVWFNAGK
jgi:hypothetical protein